MGQRHAKRLPKSMKPIRPGELVQIDTLFVNVAPDKAVKHFTAYDPVAKWTVALVAGRATARCAAALLDKLTSMPGVGPVLAFTLIALLPELGRMSRKQIAALVGLAPYDFDSGKLRDIAASTAAACRSETSSTWRPSAPAVTTPPSKHSTTASPLPARSPRSSLSRGT